MLGGNTRHLANGFVHAMENDF